MKHFASFSRLGAVLTLAAAGALPPALAQRPPVAPPPTQAAAAGVSVKDITNFNKMTVPTPDYGARANVVPSVHRGRAREWGVIDATYTTKSGTRGNPWTDSVTVVFHIMLEQPKPQQGEKPFSYFTMTVRYVNVPDGDHRAGVVLPPSYLERHGNIAAVAVEITADGAPEPAVKSDVNSNNLRAFKEDWWKNPQVMNNPNADIVVKRDGLLERSKSPFALINMDDYEAVR